MKILFIGDIVGKLGRKTVGKVLPKLKKDDNINLVIANAENIAHGRGATKAKIEEVQAYGINYFTSGNHIFWQRKFLDEIDNLPVLRPANYPEDLPGKGYAEIDLGRKGRVFLINLSGIANIKGPVYCPFRTVDRILEEAEGQDYKAIIVDFHAELTSEKVAMGWYLDGRASLVVGTHTHVPTADARILPGGTAYVTDVGMIGARDSVLGVEKEIIIRYQMNPLPERFEWVEEGSSVFNSVLVKIGKDGKGKRIKRVDEVVENF